MKILFCHRPGGAFGYITDGLINAANDLGHTTQRWDGRAESWHAFDPGLYLGASGHKQPIPAKDNRRAKVAIHVNPYGPTSILGIDESQDAINWVVKQHPDAVFGYGFDSDRIYWSYWTTKHKIQWVPMPTAGDAVVFKDLKLDRPYDFVYLGGRWSYKALVIDRYLLPLLGVDGLSYKLHGWGDWPKGISSGELPQDQANNFLNSGKIGPCVSERHTNVHGIDLPERVFKLGLTGTLSIHDPVPGLQSALSSAVIAPDPESYRKLCLHYRDNESERQELVARQQAEILNKHTYHHRMRRLLGDMGLV